MLKRPISEKQRLANIANAQKSTGPKTVRGKSISRRNAVKDGLSGAGVIPLFEGEIAAEISILDKKLKPNDLFEERLVERMALASVRLNRIHAQRESELQKRQREAIPRWDQARTDEVERLLGTLNDDPASAVHQLTRFTEGCDALCDLWDDLKSQFEKTQVLTYKELNLALNLIGEPKWPDPNSDERAARLAAMGLALYEKPDVDALAKVLGIDPQKAAEDLDALIADAKESFIPFIDQEMASLRARADHLWDTIDARDRAGATDRALIDTSPGSERLRRLEADACRMFDRTLKTLLLLRREARLGHDLVPIPDPGDEPAYRSPAQNKPISPPREPEPVKEQEVAPCRPTSPDPVQGPLPAPDPTPAQNEPIAPPVPSALFPPRPAQWINDDPL